MNYFEKRRLPFVVAVNCFDNAPRYDPEEVRIALDLDAGIPLVLCDAREAGSVKRVLITLVEAIAARRSRHRGSGAVQDGLTTPGTLNRAGGRVVGHVVAVSFAVKDITKFPQAAQGAGHNSRVNARGQGHILYRRQPFTRRVPAGPDSVREAARGLYPLGVGPAAYPAPGSRLLTYRPGSATHLPAAH